MLQKKVKNRASGELRILNGGEVPENLTGKIREFEPTHVVIIDAAMVGHEPGTVFFVNRKKSVLTILPPTGFLFRISSAILKKE